MNAVVAARLGRAYRSGSWWRCRCPVHGSAGATPAPIDGDWGLIAHCHAGCPRADITAELRRGFLDAGSSKHRPTSKRRGRETEDVGWCRQIAQAVDVWRKSYPAHGTIAEAYLRSRGPTMPVPPTSGWHTAGRSLGKALFNQITEFRDRARTDRYSALVPSLVCSHPEDLDG